MGQTTATRTKATTAVASDTLQPPAQRSLAELEALIEKGQQTFIEVGLALVEIRERKLYREKGHRSFEAYCQKQWGWSRQRGYQLLQAAEVTTTVDTSGLPERAVRELLPVKDEPQKAKAAVDEAKATAKAAGRKPTSTDVRQAVQRRAARSPQKREPSPESVAKKHAAENAKGQEALATDAYIEGALRNWEAAVAQLRYIDPEVFGKALAKLDGMHAHRQRAQQLTGDVAAWLGAVGSQIGDEGLRP